MARAALLGSLAAGLALVVGTLPTDGKSKKKSADPVEAFSELFGPVENAMGVSIKAGKMKLNLLSGQLEISSVILRHPGQGKFASASGIAFPFGALVGATDPLEAKTSMDELEADIDFGGDRFWKVQSPGGGPIPGAPALEMGRLSIGRGQVRLSHGKGVWVRLDGFKGAVKQLKVPGKTWSQGKVPAGRWADISIQGGTFSMSGQPHAVDLGKATFHMAGNTFTVDTFEATLAAGGEVSLSGTVQMTGGGPSDYDLTLDLASVRIDRPGLEATLSGKIRVTGKPGKVKLGGTLSLVDVEALEATKWSRPACTSELLLGIKLVPEKGSKLKKAMLKGTTCKGRIVLK